jgi:hypothetical protein
MTYLNKYQKWTEKGMQGNLMDDDNQSENSSVGTNEEENEDGTEK